MLCGTLKLAVRVFLGLCLGLVIVNCFLCGESSRLGEIFVRLSVSSRFDLAELLFTIFLIFVGCLLILGAGES